MSAEQFPELPNFPERSLGQQLTGRIAYWNSFFACTDHKEWDRFGMQAMEELDSYWMKMGLYGEQCFVKGVGAWEEVVIPDDEESDDESEGDMLAGGDQGPKYRERTGEISLFEQPVQSMGFSILKFEEDEHPRVRFQFNFPLITYRPGSFRVRDETSLLFLEPETATIVPVSSFRDPFHKEQTDAARICAERGEFAEAASYYSAQMVSMVCSTKFRRTKHRVQLQKIDELVEEAEMVSGVAEREVVMEPQRAIVTEVHEEGIYYRQLLVGGACITGTCIGLTMPGRHRFEKKAIRRDADLINKYDGLALAVMPDHGIVLESGLRLPSTQVLEIPLSSQEFDAYIE